MPVWLGYLVHERYCSTVVELKIFFCKTVNRILFKLELPTWMFKYVAFIPCFN